jgi:hypothetical protein
MAEFSKERTAEPYAHLRASAAARRQRTVERLQSGIVTLEAAGRPISVGTVKEVTGLDPTAIRRNAEAYRLFRQHCSYFKSRKVNIAGGRRLSKRTSHMAASATESTPRNPLANYSKPRLIRMVVKLQEHIAEQQALKHNYQTLMQEHMRCALTIARLEEDVRELAHYRKMIHQLRGRLEAEEQGGEDA